jgi:hypothetical protein
VSMCIPDVQPKCVRMSVYVSMCIPDVQPKCVRMSVYVSMCIPTHARIARAARYGKDVYVYVYVYEYA